MKSTFFASPGFVNCLPPILLADGAHYNTFNGFIFVLVTAGESVLEIDGCLYTLHSGTLVSLPPSHLLKCIALAPQFRCAYFGFSFDFMAEFPYLLQAHTSEKIGANPYIVLNPNEQALLLRCYAAINDHSARMEHASYESVLRALIFVFMAEVSHIYTHVEVRVAATQREEITDGFFRLLHTTLPTNREVRFYADKLCITPKHLSKVVSNTTGQLPPYWIAHFIMKEAKARLRSTDITITQLSELLNFPNSSFFARYFKRYAGVGPGEFRMRKDIPELPHIPT